MQFTPPLTTQSTSLSPIEREIIADIRAVCRRCGWPTDLRPKFKAYIDQRGHFYEKQIKRLGGWKKLCALAGLQKPALPVHRIVTPMDMDAILADVRLVAQSLRLKPGTRLSRAVYERSGGIYNGDAILSVGGWVAVSAAAGYASRVGARGGEPRRRQWQKTKPALAPCAADVALDEALGLTSAPWGMRRIMGGRWSKAHAAAHRAVPVLERSEVIADLRQVALSLGLLSPRLLTFDTYRNHGGQYTHEQTLTLGGFDTLRRAA